MTTRGCLVMVVLTSVLFLAGAWDAAAGESLTLGIFPRRTLEETATAYAPLADYLTAKLKRKVELKLTTNFETFWRAVSRREYDLVHYNQYHYIKSHRGLGYRVILMNEESGSATIRPIIVVRKDSGITNLAELKNRRIVFGGNRQAMVSYIGVRHLLAQAGLPAEQYREEFAANPRNVIFSVFVGLADAGGIGDTTLHLPSVKAKIDLSQLRVLATGEALPMLCWAVKHDLPVETVDRIRDAMTGLKIDQAGQRILVGIEATDLIEAEDRDYEVVRVLVKNVLAEEY